MSTSLDPRALTVLVTGATSGFGRAIARRFAAAGSRLIVTGRRAERLEALSAELTVPVLPLAFDMREGEAMDRALAGLPPDFADVDVLVNNAGLALGLNPAPRADFADWQQMIDTNCTALVRLTRALLPGMVARGRGHVVTIGSVAGDWPYPGGNVYGATKAFVKQFALNLRSDLHGTGVRVTNIEPGAAETEFSLVRFKGDADAAEAVYKGMQPLTGDDIAEAAFWAVTLPPHVNVNRVEIMATAQSFGPFLVHRGA